MFGNKNIIINLMSEDKQNNIKLYKVNYFDGREAKIITKEKDGIVNFNLKVNNKTFKGIAKCKFEYDEFDEFRGIEIARLKAEIKQKSWELKRWCK